MKNKYTAAELEIIAFEAEDVITTSPAINNDPDDDELAGL